MSRIKFIKTFRLINKILQFVKVIFIYKIANITDLFRSEIVVQKLRQNK